MFQRYTERARRVIFFARYEAGNYGSPFIRTEHLLLGLLREDCSAAKWFPGEGNPEPAIRAEIERRIPPTERISTSAEIPLSTNCRKVVSLAEDVTERLGHRWVDTEHLLIGILRVEESLAAQILIARGVTAVPHAEQLDKWPTLAVPTQPRIGASQTLVAFLDALRGLHVEDLVSFFATNALLIDASGRKWNREEMLERLETLFAPYAKRNAIYSVDPTSVVTSDLSVATVVWKNALLASEQRAWTHRMTAVLAPEVDDWKILLTQVTPIHPL